MPHADRKHTFERRSLALKIGPRVGHTFGDRIGLIDFSLDFNPLRRTKSEQRSCRGVDLSIVYDRRSPDG
jgi:hypothetical protein